MCSSDRPTDVPHRAAPNQPSSTVLNSTIPKLRNKSSRALLKFSTTWGLDILRPKTSQLIGLTAASIPPSPCQKPRASCITIPLGEEFHRWSWRNNKHPSFFLWIYFQLALHVSALRPWSHAVAYYTKTKGAGPNFTFTSESESKIRTNRSLERFSFGKIDPFRSDPVPSPTVPLLLCPHGPSMPRFFSSFADTKPPPIIRVRQAPHTWGRLGAFGFYGKHADWLKQNSPQSMKWLSRCSMLTHDLYCDISSRHFWKWAFSRKALFVSSLAVSFPIMFHKSPTKTAVEAVWVLPPINF